MPKRKIPEPSQKVDVIASDLVSAQKPTRPLIFISHDHRDASLADAFSNLLTDASGGFLQSFRSSDRKGTAGIEFGAEWYSEIMTRLGSATDVVALLTSRSVDRPWILYEAGVAKGRLSKPVFGLVIGISLEKASRGPFAQFQNSGSDEDSLTKLVLQLIRRNSDAEPREEAVRRQVGAFRDNIAKLDEVDESQPATEVESNAVLKVFEEIKVMFRDLPDRMQVQLADAFGPRAQRRRRPNPRMLFEVLATASKEEDLAPTWLIALGMLRIPGCTRWDSTYIERCPIRTSAKLSLRRSGSKGRS